ncbi:acyl-CoA thioesterase [Treponema socranskii]|uniref:acyl-CoA thioesterase n=1 Tax=Treponema socranskii TaxID=53419 RepID=UPI003614C063
MNGSLISEEMTFKIEFYDVDSMRVAWHGNYVKFIERGRCALLDKIGYGYLQMVEDGYAFPVTALNIKYVRSLAFGDEARITASLIEYENRLKIHYEIYNAKTGVLATKAESTQMAVKLQTGETCFVCPEKLIARVETLLKK